MADRNDRSEYLETGNAPERKHDGRDGFGDDGGTRVGRPDPARGADQQGQRLAASDAKGPPAGPSTNTAGDQSGLEGSILDDDASVRGVDQHGKGGQGDPQQGGQQGGQRSQGGSQGGENTGGASGIGSA